MKDTLKRIEHFILSNQLFDKENFVLVGVSGGADSVFLLHCLVQLGYKCKVAHCNFHLRGEESNRDERFVENMAKKLQLDYFKVDFDTVGFAQSEKISIEMSARKLRYDWFEKTAVENNCSVIAVAHHADDSIETMLLNLIRGTGIKGLTGIVAKRENIVRPLLCCTRNEIEKLLKEENIDFVQDSTNAENDFTRNKIRNLILPLFETINPSYRQSLSNAMHIFQETEAIYSEKINEIIPSISFYKDECLYIDIQKLQKYRYVSSLLFELLSPFGFNQNQLKDIVEALEKESGLQFFSTTHRLLKDRDFLIVCTLNNEKSEKIEHSICQIEELSAENIHLKLNLLSVDKNFKLSKSENKIHIDFDKIKFPLIVRKWKLGDSFFPLGMKNKKKLSDFFIDEKLNQIEKENCWLLTSDEKIVWIVGKRIDNRFRITTKTQRVLEISIK